MNNLGILSQRVRITALVFIGSMLLATGLAAQENREPAKAPAPGNTPGYLGQPSPGDTAVVFAKGIVSDGNVHGPLVISPDGRDLFWCQNLGNGGWRTLQVTLTANGWTSPHAAFYAFPGKGGLPTFSPDGNRLLFWEYDSGGKPTKTRFVERTAQGWSKLKDAGFMLKEHSSFTKTGRVYYQDSMAGKPWDVGFYVAEFTGAAYENAHALPAEINSPFIDNAPFVAPDESFLLFSSSRPSAERRFFLHISFRNPDGSWSTPRPMNDVLGYAGEARFPSRSPDGRLLFFCGDDGNIYWVQSRVIKKLMPMSLEAPPASPAKTK